MADEHRGRMRVHLSAWRREAMPADDARIRDVLDRLADAARRYDTVRAPDEFRDELRAQLVAITPRVVAEATPESATSAKPARRATGRRLPLARPFVVVSSVVLVLALLLGGGVLLSRNAVPGDTLYGLKRADERIELALDGNDADRASHYLAFAATRVEEARTLATRASSAAAGTGAVAGGRLSGSAAHGVTDALASADEDTRDATRLLGSRAVDTVSATPLDALTTWVPGQRSRLRALLAALPGVGAATAAATASTTVLSAAQARALWVQRTVSCNCLSAAPTDSLGPMPSAGSVDGLPTPAGSARPSPAVPATRTDGASPPPTQPGVSSSAPVSTPASAPATSAPDRPGLLFPSAGRSPTTGASSTPGRILCRITLPGGSLCPSSPGG